MKQSPRSSREPQGSTKTTLDIAVAVPAAPANDTTPILPPVLALLDDLAILIARLAYEERLDDLAPPELTSDQGVPVGPPEKAPQTP